MFESFYGLHRSPFSRDLEVGELYASVTQEETLGRLAYVAERQWFSVLISDCGTGKTTTIRRLSEKLDEAKFKLLYLSDSKLTPHHFYKGLLKQLGSGPCFTEAMRNGSCTESLSLCGEFTA